MFIDHFGLTVNPFGLSPKLDFLYRSDPFEESMAHLLYGLDNSEAITMITGSIGTGKTMSIQSFLTNLGPDFEFALVTNTRVNALELLKLILEDLHANLVPGMDKSDALILFKERLQIAYGEGKRVLIVVDEAQNLSPDALEELRLLTNLGQGESQPVQIILVGQPELEDVVNRPELAQLRQRVRVHYRLKPLSRNEVGEYINHRMAVAGGEPEVFRQNALDRIHELSQGVPRLINTLAGEGLLSAFVAGRKQVVPSDIDDGVHVVSGRGPNVPDVRTNVDDVESARPIHVVPPVEDDIVVQPATRAAAESEPFQAPLPERPVQKRDGRRWPWVVTLVIVLALVFLTQQGYTAKGWEWIQGEVRIRAGQDNLLDAAGGPLGMDVEHLDAVETSGNDTTIADADSGHVVVDQVNSEVEVAATDSDNPDPDKVTESETSAPDLYLHVSSFRARDKADLQARRLIQQGTPAEVKTWAEEGRVWYRVYLGPYSGYQEAVGQANELLESGRIQYYKIIEGST